MLSFLCETALLCRRSSELQQATGNRDNQRSNTMQETESARLVQSIEAEHSSGLQATPLEIQPGSCSSQLRPQELLSLPLSVPKADSSRAERWQCFAAYRARDAELRKARRRATARNPDSDYTQRALEGTPFISGRSDTSCSL